MSTTVSFLHLSDPQDVEKPPYCGLLPEWNRQPVVMLVSGFLIRQLLNKILMLRKQFLDF